MGLSYLKYLQSNHKLYFISILPTPLFMSIFLLWRLPWTTLELVALGRGWSNLALHDLV